MGDALRRRGWRCGIALACALLLSSSVALASAGHWSSWAARHPHRWHGKWASAHWQSKWRPASYGWAGSWGQRTVDTPLTRADAERLRPGQYIWMGRADAALPTSILVDLGKQVAYVYQGYQLVGITTVSSGRRGYDTPTGLFPILEKAVWHRSTIYSGAPMPYMQRLTWGGVALHAGGVPGYRQSHGCIHLPPAFARALYGITQIGAVVEVTHGVRTPPMMLAATVQFPTTEQAVATMTADLL